MNMTTSKLTTLALALALGVGALTTSVNADNSRQRGDDRGQRGEGMQVRGGALGGFPLMALTCAPGAAERLEAVIGDTSERLELTDEQTTAFEDFRTAALTAQTGFADTCTAFANVDTDDEVESDLIDRLTQRQLVMTAQLEAMDSVLPAFEVFYDSLTDDQKADLMPERAQRDGRRDGARDGGRERGGKMQRGMRGNAPAIAAPAAE